jgi:hypothetical protein
MKVRVSTGHSILHFRTMKRLIVSILLFMFATSVYAEKFFHDDPIWKDPDQLPIPKPVEIEVSQIYDLSYNTFRDPGKKKETGAENINTLGEVPDSSWFTNRIGRSLMTAEEIIKGPNTGTGPDMSGPWTIIRAKSQGITPGFTIKDQRGDIYFIKFDPLKNAQLATSAEVICTKFFHAFGYFVPENYLAYLRPEMLQISPDAKFTDEDGRTREIREKDVKKILKRVPKRPDGSVQVIASLALGGSPLGPFEYVGTRSDDPNDVFPHEKRRELRGMRVISAWLNHDDSRSINSLNMYIGEDGQGYIRHNLIDFGSTLGSGSVRPQSHRAGNEYIIEFPPTFRSAATLGLWDRPWRHVKYKESPAIGRFEGNYFQPEKWKPEYPNAAFELIDFEDSLWATRIIMRFTDDIVRAVVKEGKYDDPEAENYLTETLLLRRDKVIRYYLDQINPLYDFQIVSKDGANALDFTHLGLEVGLASAESYEYEWNRFDNKTEKVEAIGSKSTASTSSITLPAAQAEFFMVRIHTIDSQHPNWKGAVDVYIRNGSTPTVVGIERE